MRQEISYRSHRPPSEAYNSRNLTRSPSFSSLPLGVGLWVGNVEAGDEMLVESGLTDGRTIIMMAWPSRVTARWKRKKESKQK